MSRKLSNPATAPTPVPRTLPTLKPETKATTAPTPVPMWLCRTVSRFPKTAPSLKSAALTLPRPCQGGAMSLQTAKTFGNALNSMPRHQVTKANPSAQFQAYAAADLPDKPMGSLFTDVNDLGRSVGERMRTLSGNGKSKSSSGLLVYKRQPDEEQRPFVSPDMAPTEVQKVFNRVTDTSRLVREPDGTFQNTGWCAPSEIDYSF